MAIGRVKTFIGHRCANAGRDPKRLMTLVGSGVAALVGWFVSPAIALAIFLAFPVVYVVRVRSADH